MSTAITLAAWIGFPVWLIASLVRDERARRRANREPLVFDWSESDPRR